MSAYKWISTGLKNLRISGIGGSVQVKQQEGVIKGTQARLPPLVSTTTTTTAALESNPILQKIPPKPKKPLTPYFRFVQTIRQTVLKEQPGLSPTQLVSFMAKKWNELDPTQKNSYSEAFRGEMEKFDKVIFDWRNKLTEEQREALQKFKADAQMKKTKRKIKQKVKELGKPKKPSSAFMRYLQTQLHKNSSLEEVHQDVKDIAEKWHALPPEQKQPFIDTYTKDMATYKIVLRKWEQKMYSLGHEDVIRPATLKEIQKEK